MVEANIIGKTLCPWCNSELKVVKSPKSGYHYANCTSCNSHFRNIPIALVDMKGKEKPRLKPEPEGSALERIRREVEMMKQKARKEPEAKESALESLRRQKYA